MVKLLVQAGADRELQHKVHTLWERLILALAVCDIVAWDKANINKLIIKVPAGTLCISVSIVVVIQYDHVFSLYHV